MDKKIYTAAEWDYRKNQVGDLVEEAFVEDMINCVSPACMRSDCYQCGEPYSHRQDPDTKQWKATYTTFKAVSGTYPNRIFEYCGNCFRGENVERGNDPVYVTGGLL